MSKLPSHSAADDAPRLDAVRRYAILDTPPDGAFDRVTRIAAQVLDMPIAIISIIDTDRIWFKSQVGMDLSEIARDPGLCASAILQDAPWVVEDARKDPRALANPLVAGEFGLQFYAGAPLRTHDGYHLGTVCVIDRSPRSFGPEQRQILQDLAAIVVDELELRLAARQANAVSRDRVTLLEARERQAMQLNDDVVQSLAVAKLSLEMGHDEDVLEPLEHALVASKHILSEMAREGGSLQRDIPAAAVRG